MKDYDKLIAALRCENAQNVAGPDCVEYDCYANRGKGLYCQTAKLLSDAADAIEELMKNLNMASQELSWTISYATHLMRDIDELHDMVNEVYYDEL
jgi:hypothetical protein